MNLIVAVTKEYGIGMKGGLVLSLKEDMKFFRETTMNKIVVMGDQTLFSFPNSAPLKNRTNIVLSFNKNLKVDNAIIVYNLRELFAELKKYNIEDIFVIGGAMVYNMLLPYCKKAYITKLDVSLPADKYLTKLEDLPNWKQIASSGLKEENGVKFKFCIFENVQPIKF